MWEKISRFFYSCKLFKLVAINMIFFFFFKKENQRFLIYFHVSTCRPWSQQQLGIWTLWLVKNHCHTFRVWKYLHFYSKWTYGNIKRLRSVNILNTGSSLEKRTEKILQEEWKFTIFFSPFGTRCHFIQPLSYSSLKAPNQHHEGFLMMLKFNVIPPDKHWAYFTCVFSRDISISSFFFFFFLLFI